MDTDDLRDLADELDCLRTWAEYSVLRCDGCGREQKEADAEHYWVNEETGSVGCTEECLARANEAHM